MNCQERSLSIGACKWVDRVISDCPWYPNLQFLEDNGIDFIAHDVEPYKAGGNADVYQEFKDEGRFLPSLRTSGVSTTDILSRLIKRRKEIILRNKKKGATLEEMDVSTMEWVMIKAQEQTQNIKREVVNSSLYSFDIMSYFCKNGRREKLSGSARSRDELDNE